MMEHKIKLTKSQQKLFEDNFNREAYDMAMAPIREAVKKSPHLSLLRQNLGDLYHDTEYSDDYMFVFSEVEIGGECVKGKPSYLGLYVCITCPWDTEVPEINNAIVYTTAISHDEIPEELCMIDPNTYEVVHWISKRRRAVKQID